jgi:vitamin B12 transporter
MSKTLNKKIYLVPKWKLLFTLIATILLCRGSLLHAEENIEPSHEEETAALFGDSVIPVTTFGRQPRLINQVAENVTIITREDIKRLQAHTLGDALQFYPGVLAYPFRNSNDLSVPMIQGLPNRQALVIMDGVPLNNGSDGIMDINALPAASLERIEIVKGPAASVWGRSVGAVINLVSIDPNKERKLSGKIIGSLGTKQSEFGAVDVSGYFPETGTGYHLGSTGNHTNGFQKGIDGSGSSHYTKITQDIGPHTDLTGVFAWSQVDRNIIYTPEQNVRGTSKGTVYFGTGKLHHEFSPGSDFEAQIYAVSAQIDTKFYNLNAIPFVLPAGIQVQTQGIREETEGIQLSYKKSASKYWFTIGVDASQGSLRNSNFSLLPPPVNTHSTKYPYNVAEYISGGFNITNKLTLTGSYRYDWYSLFDNTHSPNLGLIYKITEKSLIRASYGYGYSLPTVASNSRSLETLWRAQIGLETNDIPFLWFKINGFYDRMNNVKLQLKFFDQTPEINHALTREGFEVEAKTTPFLNTTFGLGYTYAHIYNSDTGADIAGLPRHHLLLSAAYHAHGTDALLYARYINWNGTSSTDQVIWDFLLTQQLFSWDTGNANLTFSVRNMTNASQQSSPIFTNPPRRIDAGFTIYF